MTGTDDVDLSAIIISHGHEAVLPACVGSLRLAMTGLTAEIILLDNIPGGTAEDVCRGGGVRSLRNPAPQGFACNVNRAAAVARGRYILLLNPDTCHAGGRIAEAVALLEARPDVGVVGCTLLNPDGSPQQSYRRFPTLPFLLARGLGADRWPWRPRFYQRGLMTGEQPDGAQAVDWVFGAFMLMRRRDFEAIGGMDASFRLYYEDVDLCYRFRRAGLATWVYPGVRFVHEDRRDSAAIPFGATWRWHLASAVRYFWKNSSPADRRVTQ